MWEHTLIESKGFGRVTKRWWTIPAAAGFHAALIIAAILASYWQVEAVEAPLARLSYLDVFPVHISPPPARGGGRSPSNQAEKREDAKVVQPTDIPPLGNETSLPIEQLGPENMGMDGNAPTGEGIGEGIDGSWGTTPLSTGSGIPAEEEPQVISAGVTPPVLIKRIEPEYPRMAAHIHLQGMVVLEAVITRNGDVEQIRTLRANHVLFEKAATDAVLQWKYKPALVQGRPIKVYFTVTVTFRLR